MKSETEARKIEDGGAAFGCFAGGLGCGCLIPFGIMLCATGIGAIIGVPLILIGLFSPLVGWLLGLGALEGECPWCGEYVMSTSIDRGINCPACKKRIVIKDQKFIKIE